MSNENIKSVGGSWFDSLYQKFEAVCQEVDDIVKHDHRKSLENSVQLVGGNVIKFCSNVKDLIPSNAGAPLKDVEQSLILVESNSDVETGDKECFSVAITEQFLQQIDVTDSSKGWPYCSEVSDVHFKNSLENPSFKDPCSSSSGLQLGQSESFSICQDRNLVSKEWKQPSGMSDPRYTDRSLTDQNFDSITEEKQPISNESELTYHVSSMTNENFDLFTEKEEPLSGAPELTFPDEDPCESSMFQIQNGKLDEEESIDYLSAASIHHSSGSEIHKKENPLQENVDEQSSEPECSFIDGTVNDNIPENSPGPQIYLKEEMISDINHKVSQESELQVEEESLPCPLTTSSATPTENEISNVRMTSTVTYPLLHFSDSTETNSQCTECHTFNCKDAEIGSVSTFVPASPASELCACLIFPKENVGAEDSSLFPFTSQEFTEVPINSPGESEGLKLKQMEVPGKSELDESCIFVQNDRNDIDLSAAGRRWTYKKKMRNPFTSRKKLEKEYKQLSLWYCDIDAEFKEVAGDKLVPSSHNDKHKDSSAQDLQDSEWELV